MSSFREYCVVCVRGGEVTVAEQRMEAPWASLPESWRIRDLASQSLAFHKCQMGSTHLIVVLFYRIPQKRRAEQQGVRRGK